MTVITRKLSFVSKSLRESKKLERLVANIALHRSTTSWNMKRCMRVWTLTELKRAWLTKRDLASKHCRRNNRTRQRKTGKCNLPRKSTTFIAIILKCLSSFQMLLRLFFRNSRVTSQSWWSSKDAGGPLLNISNLSNSLSNSANMMLFKSFQAKKTSIPQSKWASYQNSSTIWKSKKKHTMAQQLVK